MRVFVPLDTISAAFSLAVLLLGLGATIALQARRVISTRRALYMAILILASVTVNYLGWYGMGFWHTDSWFLTVRCPQAADWFPVALILANLILAAWTIYASAEGTLPVARGLLFTLVSAISSAYLIVLWELLPPLVRLALPSWLDLPTQPDPFNFALMALLAAALVKIGLDWLKQRIGWRRAISRAGIVGLVTALEVIGWYSSARVLVMPTLPGDLTLVVGIVIVPLTVADALVTRKRGYWLRPVPMMQTLFAVTAVSAVLATNLQPWLLWCWATATMQDTVCEPAVSTFKTVMSLNPKLSVPAQKIARCDNRRMIPLNAGPRKIVFMSDRAGKWSLFTMNEDGSDQQRLNNGFTGDTTYGASWSPDGQRLAFSTKTANAWYIYTMRADGSQLTLLKSAFYSIANPHWLPDGEHLTYTNFVSGRNQLYMMDNNGSDDHLFIDMGYTFSSAWSPNAPYLVFGGTPSGELARLYLRSLDGTIEYPLIKGDPFAYENAWSADGQWIAFTAMQGHRGIGVVRIDGTDLQTLTKIGAPDEGDNWHPTWSPDGQRLAFSSDRTGKSGVYVMNADGSGVRCLACGLYNSESPTWQP